MRIQGALLLVALAVPAAAWAGAAELYQYSDGPGLIALHGTHALEWDVTFGKGGRTQTGHLRAEFRSRYNWDRGMLDPTALDATWTLGTQTTSAHVLLEHPSQWSYRDRTPPSIALGKVWALAQKTLPFMVTATREEWDKGEMSYSDDQGSLETSGPCEVAGFRGLAFRARIKGKDVEDTACISPEVPLPLELTAHFGGDATAHWLLTSYDGDGPARDRVNFPPYVYFYGRPITRPRIKTPGPALPETGWSGPPRSPEGKRAVLFCDSGSVPLCLDTVEVAAPYFGPGALSVVVASPRESSRRDAALRVGSSGVPVLSVIERGSPVVEDWGWDGTQSLFLLGSDGAIAGAPLGTLPDAWTALRAFAGEGTIDMAKVRAAVAHDAKSFQACAKKRKPAAHGRLDVEIAIARDGDRGYATYARIPGGTIKNDGAVEACVLDHLYDMTFPAPKGGPARAAFPLSL